MSLEATGYIVALKIDKNKYLCKDLANMDETEFILWLASVFPVDLKTIVPEEYSSVEAKVSTFNAVIKWHSLQLFIPRKAT